MGEKTLLLPLLLLLLLPSCVLARDDNSGRWDGNSPAVREWFKSVRSPQGVPCCDIADGHRTTWEKRVGDDRYWVPIEGRWTSVPVEAVVQNAGNPTGEAIVWYTTLPIDQRAPEEREYYIRCFVPGGGV